MTFPLIFNGKTVIIPLAGVQHIEKRAQLAPPGFDPLPPGIVVVMKSSRWSKELDGWENNAWLSGAEAEEFTTAWLAYVKSSDINGHSP